MMNTIEKRTFNNGSTIELFQRKDGTHRIKYTGIDGDEISVNLNAERHKNISPLSTFSLLLINAEPPKDTYCNLKEYDKAFSQRLLCELIGECGLDIKSVLHYYTHGEGSGKISKIT